MELYVTQCKQGFLFLKIIGSRYLCLHESSLLSKVTALTTMRLEVNAYKPVKTAPPIALQLAVNHSMQVHLCVHSRAAHLKSSLFFHLQASSCSLESSMTTITVRSAAPLETDSN